MNKIFSLSIALLALLGVGIAQLNSNLAHATADSVIKNTQGVYAKRASDGKYYNAQLCFSTDGSQALVPCREGGSGIAPGYLDSSLTNINNSVATWYSPVIASTAADAKAITVYNGGSVTLALATGASGSETDKLMIAPSGWTPAQKLYIPAGTRVSVRSKGASVSSGVVLINLIQ